MMYSTKRASYTNIQVKTLNLNRILLCTPDTCVLFMTESTLLGRVYMYKKMAQSEEFYLLIFNRNREIK